MLTITKLKMWKDVNYTKRCVEVPPAGSTKLPAVADYVLPVGESIRPRKTAILTSIEIPASYLAVMDMTYLYIEASDGNNSVKLYGWVDSITETATSAESVRIDWTVDWWRSYAGTVTYGPGTITRCDLTVSGSGYVRPYPVNPRYKKMSGSTPIYPALNTDETNTYWIIITLVVTFTDLGNTVTALRKVIIPAGDLIWYNSTLYYTIDLTEAYAGFIDEMMTTMISSLGIDNYDIVSAYVSPIKPDTKIVWDSANSGWKSTDSAYVKTYTSTWRGSPYAIFQETILYHDGMFGSFTRTVNAGTMTDDESTYHITDFEGNFIGNVPWGIPFDRILSKLDIGPVGGYIKVFLYENSDSTDIEQKSIANGMSFTIPLPSIPVTENQWSDYVLSGQRNYDRQNREISREQTAIQGLTGIGASALGGTISGALVGGPVGAGVGAVAGSTGSLASTGINYWLSGIYNDKLNDLQDQLYSRQKNTIQETGYSMKWVTVGSVNGLAGPKLIKMTIDSASLGEMSGDRTYNGYIVQEPVGSTSAWITAGGPLQISNQIITGNAPAVAKDYIKNILEKGIRIVENNPYGVTP